jgi:hypothetical protein
MKSLGPGHLLQPSECIAIVGIPSGQILALSTFLTHPLHTKY